jgi:phosphopantothenoylcysteine decarboxylase/phosphopantothenate--cysteine ligase
VRIVVGITGGIAAYKAVALVRLLVKAGHDVKVIPTQNALRFVGSATLEAISRNTVDPDLYTDVADVKHVELGQSADLIIVAPATASFIARTAAGLADDLLSNVILASKAPIVIAPAMHTEMWQNVATERNIETLKRDGTFIVEPTIGQLTGNDVGSGRMAEPEEIFESALAATCQKDLLGKRILISAGGTREPIDPVRFIGNSSSGKQGLALAQAASNRGAEVTLVLANVQGSQPFRTINVGTASELLEAMRENVLTSDAVIMAAAVGDFRVAEQSQTKIKKSQTGENFSISVVQNEDVLASLRHLVSANNFGCLLVGFAAETQPDSDKLQSLALAKMEAKGCDLMVANDVSDGQVFDQESSSVIIVAKDQVPVFASGSKHVVADVILDSMAQIWKTK